MEKITLLLVDDHPVVRRGLGAELEQDARLAVVGEAGSVAEAVAEAEHKQPQVAVIDVQLPDGTGIEACRHIRARCLETRVLIFTAFDWDVYLAQAWTAGAAGFVVKGVDLDGVVEAIWQAACGNRLYTSEQLQRIQAWQEAAGAQLAALTVREWEVMQLLMTGKSNRDIAEALVLSQNTVEKHIGSLLRKLGVCSRQALVAFALQYHLEPRRARPHGGNPRFQNSGFL